MPKIHIQARAQLNAIKSIAFDEDHPFHLTLKCCNCGETTPKPVVISKQDSVQGLRGSTVTASIKCSLCGRVNDITILKLAEYQQNDDDEPKFQTMVSLECRGLEPTALIFADDSPLKIVATSGHTFENSFMEFQNSGGIELGEFYDWDEKASVDVSVTEFQIQFSKVA